MILLTALLLLASPRELNDSGMKAYRARQLEQAVDLFKKALAEDPEEKTAGPSVREQVERAKLRALIHHNLACAQSLLRARGQVCVTDNYRGDIVKHLHESVRFDPSRLDRATRDPDLAAVRDTLGFQSLLGLSIERDVDLPALLPRVKWWSPGQGAFGSLSDLTFKADGSCVMTTKVISEDGRPLAPKVEKGRWKLLGRKLSLELSGGKKVEGQVTQTGLELEGTLWSDSPSECDA